MDAKEISGHRPTKKERRIQRQLEADRTKEVKRRYDKRMRYARRGVLGLGLSTVAVLTVREARNITFRPQTENRITSEKTSGADIAVKEKEYSVRKETVDQLIKRVEEGMRRFRLTADPLIAQLDDPKLRDIMRRPFEAIEANRGNHRRNRSLFYLEDLQRQKKEGRMKAVTTKVELSDKAYFFYDIMLPWMFELNIAAAFGALDRTLHLSEQFDQYNLFDLLIVYHEGGHAFQDTIAREEREDRYGIPYQTFWGLYEQKGIILDFELEMYAAELSLVNLLTQGRFAQDCTGDSFPVKTYITEMNAREGQAEQIDFLAHVGKAYFSSGATPIVFTPEFTKVIRDNVRVTGLVPYRLTRNALLRDTN